MNLSPKPDFNIEIDNDENIEPSDKELSKIANRFSPKKKIHSVFETGKKRRKSKRKRSRSYGRKRSKRKSRRQSRKKRFGLRIQSGMAGLAYN